MLRYLQAAFLYRSRVAGLGGVPVNVLAVIGFLILGFAFPAVWLLGLGLETAFLFGLAMNPRFQRIVKARENALIDERDAQSERTVVERLTPQSRARVAALENKLGKIMYLYHDSQTEPFVIENNREALQKLIASYIGLLKTQETLHSLDGSHATEERLTAEISALERDIESGRLSQSARDAKSATLKMLHRRLENLGRREESLQEIDSYLAQIEAQFDLTLETATLRGRQLAISADIDVASFLLDERFLSESEPYSQPPRGEQLKQ